MKMENFFDYGMADKEMPELQEVDFVMAKPNRFAIGLFHLDKDLQPYFKTEKDINKALRLMVQLNGLISCNSKKINY